MSRRATLEALRAGPALVAGLPAEVVDIDRLLAHLVARAFQGGVHIAGGTAEGLLWVYDGATQEAWSFEPGGTEAVLQGETGRELIRQIATQGARVSVLVGAPPVAPPAPRTVEDPQPVTVEPVPPEPVRHDPAPPEPVRPQPTPPPQVRPGASEAGIADEPSPHPWPAILQDVAERVARHRGARLAARFMTALEAALAPYGGRITNGRITTPPLDRSTWRIIVEAACAPVVAIAGRAFVDRTIAASERHVSPGRTKGGSRS